MGTVVGSKVDIILPKRLLWHSDTPCDPAYVAHSEQHQGESHWLGAKVMACMVGVNIDSDWGMHNLDCMALWCSGGVLQHQQKKTRVHRLHNPT